MSACEPDCPDHRPSSVQALRSRWKWQIPALGLHQEALPHIFERFYQADPSRPGGEKHGTGLGLAIVKEIVGAHGGKISVRSTLDEGSTFTVQSAADQTGCFHA